MIELGGNIKLLNFEAVEPALLIVVKKIVGNYTKKISEKVSSFKEIEVSLEIKSMNTITVKVHAEQTYETEAKDENLFFALDKALSIVLSNL